MEVSCECCKKELQESTLLKHIVQAEKCNSFYGTERIKEMKRTKEKLRKRQYRQGLSDSQKEKILKKKREYDQKSEIKEKRKEIKKEKEAEKAKIMEEANRIKYKHQEKERLKKKRMKRQIMKQKVRKMKGKMGEEGFKEYLENKKKRKEKILQEKKDIACENCKRMFSPNTLLKHIVNQELCKSFYGPRYLEMKKEKNKNKMQKFREKYGTGEELDRQVELYSSNPAKKERKKQYYIANKESIKETRKRRRDKIAAEKTAEMMPESYEYFKGVLESYKNSRDDKARFRNKLGLDFATENLKAGVKALNQKDLSDDAKLLIKKFENDIKMTYEKFQSQIEDIKVQINSLKYPDFDEWKENGIPDDYNCTTVAKMYSHLLTDNDCVIDDTWHDIRMWIDIKFLEATKAMKIKYYGNDACKCHECQKVKGVKNIKKIHAIKGYKISEWRYQWARNKPIKSKSFYKF